jgi:YegS/Rv2252/BmrU family lipid kinase
VAISLEVDSLNMRFSVLKEFRYPINSPFKSGKILTMLRASIVYNPSAGPVPSWVLTENAAKYLHNRGWILHIEKTIDSNHITELAYKAVEEKFDVLIIVGGDGSINKTLPALIDSSTALGVFPTGTSNVWAQEIGLPCLTWTHRSALDESARFILDARVRTIDVGIINSHPFLLWAGIGLDAYITHRLEPRSRWEKHFTIPQYAASVIWNANYWKGMNLKINVDGSQIDGHFLLAIISNISLYAGGLAKLSPNSSLDDGYLDLWLFEGENFGEIVRMAWNLWTGRHVESEYVEHVPFRSLSMESDSTIYAQIDGEPLEVVEKVEIHTRTHSLRVLAPG